MAVPNPPGEVISLIRAREEAQASLAEAAARCAQPAIPESILVGAGDSRVPNEDASIYGVDAPPSSPRDSQGRGRTKKKVAKVITSRGVRLRNRII